MSTMARAGLVGVVEDDEFHYEPIPLTDADTWLYPVSLPHVVDAIRKDNGIDGTSFRNENGLISVGQRSVAGVGLVGVYLSLPNSSADSVMARCRRLMPIVGERCIALLTPCILDLSREDLGILASGRVVTISLMAAAGKGHLTLNWDEALAILAAMREHPRRAARPKRWSLTWSDWSRESRLWASPSRPDTCCEVADMSNGWYGRRS